MFIHVATVPSTDYLLEQMRDQAAKWLAVEATSLEFISYHVVNHYDKPAVKAGAALGYLSANFRSADGAPITVAVSEEHYAFLMARQWHLIEPELVMVGQELFDEYNRLYAVDWASSAGKRIRRRIELRTLPWWTKPVGSYADADRQARDKYYLLGESLEIEAFTVIDIGDAVQFDLASGCTPGVLTASDYVLPVDQQVRMSAEWRGLTHRFQWLSIDHIEAINV